MCMSGFLGGSLIDPSLMDTDLKYTSLPSPVSLSGLYLHSMYIGSASVSGKVSVADDGFFVLYHIFVSGWECSL